MRSRHRQQSHDSAHSDADAAATGSGRPLEHPLVPKNQAPLIVRQADLAALVARLRTAGAFAYDSEFIGELTYIPKLCLIQVASTAEVALIDPLAGLDLHPFWELLCDPAVLKIVHAGQQDVEPVFRHAGRPAANLFDTQIAAGFIGLNYPLALTKLISVLLGHRVGKGLTVTNWDHRPLTHQQLHYAADDVRYLPALHAALLRRLDEVGHMDFAVEESAALCDPELYRFDPQTAYRRIRGAVGLAPQNTAVLRELVAWRDGVARAEDLPSRSVVPDQVVLDMARRPPRDVPALNRVRGLPRPVEERHGKSLVEAVLHALSIPASDHPKARFPEPSPTEQFHGDALWAATECLCFARNIDPSLVTSRQEITQLLHQVQSGVEPSQLRLIAGWRRVAIGNDVLRLARESVSFTVTSSAGKLVASDLHPSPGGA
jgi:ribonuclease D